MILDILENAYLYQDMIKNIETGILFIKEYSQNAPGRYELSDGVFAMIQQGDTNPIAQGVFETHKKYIDFQYMIKGQEVLEWAPASGLKQKIDYDENKDAGFYEGKGNKMTITEGMFYIMFPNDGHKACCHEEKAQNYRKIVIKYPVERGILNGQ